MKLFIVMTILAISYLGNEVAADHECQRFNVTCEPNKRFLDEDGCNGCMCSDDGQGASCTLMLCPEPKPVPLDQRPCTPRKTFKAGCQRCRCGRNGYVDKCCGGH